MRTLNNTIVFFQFYSKCTVTLSMLPGVWP